MGYEGDELVRTENPKFARMALLDSLRKIRANIFQTINNVHIFDSLPLTNFGLDTNKTGENEYGDE